VRANRGAPGADGITIAGVEASGVAAFLDDLAAALRAGTYRPAPLRRVHIRRLRTRLGDNQDSPHIIKTVRGVGYRLIPPPRALRQPL